jgi:hypothetical protein
MIAIEKKNEFLPDSLLDRVFRQSDRGVSSHLVFCGEIEGQSADRGGGGGCPLDGGTVPGPGTPENRVSYDSV